MFRCPTTGRSGTSARDGEVVVCLNRSYAADAPAHQSDRLQNVSTTRDDSGGLTRTAEDESSTVTNRDSNPYRQKSRAINHLQTRAQRVQIPPPQIHFLND